MSKNAELQERVLAELAFEPRIDAGHIGVVAADGVVTLTGHVATYGEKQAAERATVRVWGVKAVADEIDVKLPFGDVRDDSEVAAAALARLAWDPAIPEGVVKIVVREGWITLSGEVDHRYQRDAAQDEVRHLWGVVGVSNDITLAPVVNTGDLAAEITQALHRSWSDARTITVAADAGRIRLTGAVKTWGERSIAAAAAWAAPGVTSVENDLLVS